jgi:hypothetical protein
MPICEFTPMSVEFVPIGIIAGHEEFSDLDSAFGGVGKKEKKAAPTKAKTEAEKKATEALTTKGKPSQFFKNEGHLTQD